MKKYEVKLTETLSRIVTIEAESKEDALLKAHEMDNNEEIVLDYTDLTQTEIEVTNNENE